MLSAKLHQACAELLTRYPEKRSALLPLLHLVQEELGYLTPESMEDVARLLEILLDIDFAIAEGGLGFGLGGCHRNFEVVFVARDLHAAAAAACRCLDDDGVANGFCRPPCFGNISNTAF